MATYGLDGKPIVRTAAKPQTKAQKDAAKKRGEAARKQQARLEQIARLRAKGIFV